jgi:hypothetical protein
MTETPPEASQGKKDSPTFLRSLSAAGYRLSVGVYYLLLGLWLGGLAGFALAAPPLFQRLRLYQPEAQQRPAETTGWEGPDATIIAGDIATRILANLATLQIIAAIGLAVLVILQCTIFRRWLSRGVRGGANVVRLALLGLAIAALAVQLGWFSPKVRELRREKYQPGQTPQQVTAAHDRLETYHTRSERTLRGITLLLGVTIVISPFALTPAGRGGRDGDSRRAS